jgi:uridine kinase
MKKIDSKPDKKFIIGVAGGSGSGKTTVVKNLTKLLPQEAVTCISHDDYYRDQSHLSFQERTKTNYDHPNALETNLLVDHLVQLSQGQTVEKPIYNFEKHNRSDQTEVIKPAQVIIVEGILVLSDADLAASFDLKVFVDTDPDLRIIRRIRRDVEERDRTFDQSVKQYLETTRPMHLQFVEPSKRTADIIIPEGGENTIALDVLTAKVREMIPV